MPCCTKKICCPPAPVVPECRASIKDALRTKPCVVKCCCPKPAPVCCPPKQKCKLPSIKDHLRVKAKVCCCDPCAKVCCPAPSCSPSNPCATPCPICW